MCPFRVSGESQPNRKQRRTRGFRSSRKPYQRCAPSSESSLTSTRYGAASPSSDHLHHRMSTATQCPLLFSPPPAEHRPAFPGVADKQFRRESALPQLQAGFQRTLQVCFMNQVFAEKQIKKKLYSLGIYR